MDAIDLPLAESSRNKIESCLQLVTPLSTLEFPFEAHLLCHYFNWDDDPSPIIFVAEHPKCDLGTALMVYWEAGIEEFLERDPETLRRAPRKVYDIVMSLQDRIVRNDFLSREIAYGPELNVIQRRKYSTMLPSAVMSPSPGIKYRLW